MCRARSSDSDPPRASGCPLQHCVPACEVAVSGTEITHLNKRRDAVGAQVLNRQMTLLLAPLAIAGALPLLAGAAVRPPPLQPVLSAREISARYGACIALVLGTDESGAAKSLGTGVFVSADGRVVTTLHVSRGCTRARIIRGDSSTCVTSTVVAVSASEDLVLLDSGKRRAVHAALGNSDSLAPGDPVVVLSNPEGLQRSVSTGVISGIRVLDSLRTLVQFSAPVSPGSSGGAVFNGAGQVVAIVASQLSNAQNLNFGIPANSVKRLLGSREPRTFAEANEMADATEEANSELEEPNTRNLSPEFVDGIWNGVVANFS